MRQIDGVNYEYSIEPLRNPKEVLI